MVDDNIFNLVTVQTIIETEFANQPRPLKCDTALNGKLAVEAVKNRQIERS